MSDLRRTLYGYRFVEILYGDTLQAIASRELGDASRWAEIVSYNDLKPPYLTGDAAQAGHGVLLYGSLIRLPASAPVVSSTNDPDRVFERDVRLTAGRLGVTDGGDLDIVSGVANLKQALQHRVDTDRGELIYHAQDYGSLVRRLVGSVNGPTAGLLAAEYAKAAVLADQRISTVTNATAEMVGDVIRVSVEAQPVVGRPVEVQITT